MVLPAKIFEIKEDVNLFFVAQKLKTYREEEPYTTISGETINLVSEITDLKVAKKILMLIDGYRILNIEDFAWADKEVKEGKMGKRFSQDWKGVREVMLKFAREAGSQKHLLNLAALQQILLQFGLVISAITTLLTTLSMVAFLFHFEWAKMIPEILTYSLIPLILGIVIMVAGPPLIARKITSELEKFYE
ncbi:MAG: hypothetical protein QXV74_05395, partial [Candidatus Bathyarchaeia archaeon]